MKEIAGVRSEQGTIGGVTRRESLHRELGGVRVRFESVLAYDDDVGPVVHFATWRRRRLTLNLVVTQLTTTRNRPWRILLGIIESWNAGVRRVDEQTFDLRVEVGRGRGRREDGDQDRATKRQHLH